MGLERSDNEGVERETRPRSRQITNLLVNPHETIRTNQEKQKIDRGDDNAKRHAAGERWWGHEAAATSDRGISLGAQPPFLDGGEGELHNANSSVPVIFGGGGNLSGSKEFTGGRYPSQTPQQEIERKPAYPVSTHPSWITRGGTSRARIHHNIGSRTSDGVGRY